MRDAAPPRRRGTPALDSAKLTNTLERKLGALPDQPGVYLWKDAHGAVLYVGKAKNLRQRVRSYFAADTDASPRTRSLLRHIADLDTIVVPSEPQALLLENNLIKEHRPRYNIALRDDKSYPSIAVTLAEPFPRIVVGRRLNIPGARLFGPYTDVAVLRRTLQVIRRIFTVRSCHYDLPADAPDRPCLDYHIHRCLAPCVGYQSQAEYRRMMDDVVAFLEGRTVEVRRSLRERMDDAAARLEFERAAEIRNALRWLDQLERPAAVETVTVANADAIGFARDGDDAVGVVLHAREGKIVARDHRFLANLAEEPDAAALGTFLIRHYRSAADRASLAVLPFPPADFEDLASLLPDTRFHVPRRGAYHRLVELADQNARHLLESLFLESLVTDERVEDPVYALGRDLGLTAAPRSMVCVDISTSQGRDTVGAIVWFEGGRPKKSEYRKYWIRGRTGEGTEQGPHRPGPRGPHGPDAASDDVAAIREVVSRFVSRRREENKPLPDLMVIDGGKGQLNAAREALESSGAAHVPVISLAKRNEEIFVPGHPDSLRLPRRAPSLRLLQRARDEAHRFALTYNRARRAARTITSALLEVPGVGPARRRALLERFGSLAGVRLATPEEIAAIPGFSLRLADRILEHVRKM
ncbi:MAG TPA: excinuclease ABC subunit UvrC [Gemmatimonadales bacterium]|nr:excinuclease ABC subunit UvrC [Gemmatimonadales bacterium]